MAVGGPLSLQAFFLRSFFSIAEDGRHRVRHTAPFRPYAQLATFCGRRNEDRYVGSNGRTADRTNERPGRRYLTSLSRLSISLDRTEGCCPAFYHLRRQCRVLCKRRFLDSFSRMRERKNIARVRHSHALSIGHRSVRNSVSCSTVVSRPCLKPLL